MKAPYERSRVTGPVVGPSLNCSVVFASTAYTWVASSKTWKITSSNAGNLTGVSGMSTYDYGMMNDIVTPGYKYLSENGAIICNDLSMSREQRKWIVPLSCVCSGLWRAPKSKQFMWSYSGVPSATALGLQYSNGMPNMLNLSSTGPVVNADIDAEARWTLAEAFQAMSRSPINVWVSTGEFAESYRTFLGIYQKIDALCDFRKKENARKLIQKWHQRRRAGQVLKWKDLQLCSNHWLEMRYGLRPLIRELLAALKLLDRVYNKTRRRFVSNRLIRCEPLSQVQQRNAVNMLSIAPQEIGYSVQAIWEREFSISAGVLAQPKFNENNLSTLIGLGSIVQGAWDLVPYSFVINWFVNVSATLSAWAPSLLVEPKASWYVVQETERRTSQIVPDSCYMVPTHGAYGSLLQGSASMLGCYQWEKVSTTRVANPDRLVIPEVRFALRASNCLDTVSLMIQNLK